MFESLGALAFIIGLAVLWYGKGTINVWTESVEEDIKVNVAESAILTTKRTQEANAELEKILSQYDKVVSADEVIQKARGK